VKAADEGEKVSRPRYGRKYMGQGGLQGSDTGQRSQPTSQRSYCIHRDTAATARLPGSR